MLTCWVMFDFWTFSLLCLAIRWQIRNANSWANENATHTGTGNLNIRIGYLSPFPHRQWICIYEICYPEWTPVKQIKALCNCSGIFLHVQNECELYKLEMCTYLVKTNLLCFTAPPTVRHWVNLPRQGLGNHVRHRVLLPCKPHPYLKVKKFGSEMQVSWWAWNIISSLNPSNLLTSVVPMSQVYSWGHCKNHYIFSLLLFELCFC